VDFYSKNCNLIFSEELFFFLSSNNGKYERYDWETICVSVVSQTSRFRDICFYAAAIDVSLEHRTFAARNDYAFINHGDRLKRPEMPLASRQRL
jgi:hypothetical protein